MDSPSCENLWSIIEVGRSQARLLYSPPKRKRRHIPVSLAPPSSDYTPKVFAARTIHRIDLVINPAQLAHSLNKKNKPVCIFLLTTPRM